MLESSLLDTDFYKLTMMQCVFHRFSTLPVEYRLILRKPVDLRPLREKIAQAIHQLCSLRFTSDEVEYLTQLGYFKTDFLEYIRNFSLDEAQISFVETSRDMTLRIQGTWVDTILFEVPLLALISEIYYAATIASPDYQMGRDRLQEKIHFFKQYTPDITLIEFGTRRRFSQRWHQEVIQRLVEHLPLSCVGTSNIYFARLFNIRPMGTMAHEYLQACQVLAPNIRGSQRFAMQQWLEEYPHDLSIALTDVLTMDIFLTEFDEVLANRYQGLRQDSGDPIVWGEKALRHYQALGIDPRQKIFVFSDNLNPKKAVDIFHHFKGRCQPVFGIGTNLTNDLGYTPLDMVVKMIHADHRSVIKITDSPGKTVCDDPEYLEKIKTLFNIKDSVCDLHSRN